jgi:hypothetical protein
MRAALLASLIVLVSCAEPGAEPTTMTASTTTTTSTTAPPTTQPEVRICPAAPYEIGFFPITVNRAGFDPTGLEPDVWTSVGGTHTTFFGRHDGTVAIALIRGTLPAVDWPGAKGETTVDGVRAAVGPHPDGTWVMGWYLEPAERCDLYTMVFYPPWSPGEVEQVILSMIRVPG